MRTGQGMNVQGALAVRNFPVESLPARTTPPMVKAIVMEGSNQRNITEVTFVSFYRAETNPLLDTHKL
jgi:hypothetical protein